MNRILIVTALFPPEPVVSANLSFEIASELSINRKVTVISPYPSRPNGLKFEGLFESENSNIKHIYLRSFISSKSNFISRFWESISFGLKTYNFIKNNHFEFDAIYMNTWPLFAQYLTVKAAKKFGKPIVTHIQDIYPESFTQKLPFLKDFFTSILLPIDKFILRNSKSVITISNNMCKLLAYTRNLDNSKISVAYNWQNEELFKHNLMYEPDLNKKFIFMYLGSINKLANINNIIIGFHNANLSDAELIIAGDGPEKSKLIELVDKLKNGNIKFTSVSNNEAAKLQSMSDVLLLSLKPGASKLAFPSKIPAYMFSAKPILAFVDNDSEIANTITSANCGWFVDVRDLKLLTKKMTEVRQLNKYILFEMGMKGKEYALEKLSKSSNLQIIINQITK